jgi:hypothetical protein
LLRTLAAFNLGLGMMLVEELDAETGVAETPN